MAVGRLLIINGDEWESALLSKYLTGAGFEVQLATEARAGFEQVRALEPDCILCAVDLPDIDGFWVARRVRTEASRVAATPLLLLTHVEDRESRLHGLNVGADLFLTRPFHEEEAVAQVRALIDMANRLRRHCASISPEGSIAGVGAALSGDIAQVSVTSVLTLLELERRSGQLQVRSDLGKLAVFNLSEGGLTTTELDGKAAPVLPVLRAVLRWRNGRFTFGMAVSPLTAGPRLTVGGLLIEAMRLEDEARR